MVVVGRQLPDFRCWMLEILCALASTQNRNPRSGVATYSESDARPRSPNNLFKKILGNIFGINIRITYICITDIIKSVY